METDGETTGVLGTVALCTVTLCLLCLLWGVFALGTTAVAGRGVGVVVGTVVTLGSGVASVRYGRGSATSRLAVAGHLLVIGLAASLFVLVVSLVVAVSPFTDGSPGIVDATVVLLLASGCLVGFLLALRDMAEYGSWSLTVRLFVTVLVLGLCTICLFVAVWVAVWALFGPGWYASQIGFVAGAVILTLIGAVEYRQLRTVTDSAGATVVSTADRPDLHARVTRIAAQLDVPAPTLALADRQTPEALVVGFRPSETRLVLSTGLLDTLTGDELDAVIAHELAHVANRDATVMTVLAGPIVVANGMLARSSLSALGHKAPDRGGRETGHYFAHFIPLALFVRGIGRANAAYLSRAREITADRVAAEVTGSPATLASALRKLDARIDATLDRDLRQTAGISALSILPLHRSGGVVDGDDTNGKSDSGWFRTHPPTAKRLEQLRRLEREQT